MEQLTTLSPLDGRYRPDVAALEAYFSEAALFRYRARIEIEYLHHNSLNPIDDSDHDHVIVRVTVPGGDA